MSDGTAIEWTDATWNPVTGCSVHSPGCTNCYAMQLAATRLRNHWSRKGLTRQVNGEHVWTGEVRFNAAWLMQPIGWKRPRTIFVCAHADLFHEDVPDAWIDQVFAVMALTPQHRYQVLTKRSARMRAYLGAPERASFIRAAAIFTLNSKAGCHARWPLPNVWLGVSVEDQRAADARIPDLLATPAAVRFLSCEPLLGPVDIASFMNAEPGNVGTQGDAPCSDDCGAVTSGQADAERVVARPASRIDWVIVGGESGPGARPMHPDWARGLRDRCAAAGVPFFFKQWGEWRETDGPKTTIHNRKMNAGTHWLTRDGRLHARGIFSIYAEYRVAQLGKKAAGRMLDGVLHDGMPA